MRKIHFTDKYLLSPYHPITVLVAGAGGTGSQVITSLARMSVALQALGHPGLSTPTLSRKQTSAASCSARRNWG